MTTPSIPEARTGPGRPSNLGETRPLEAAPSSVVRASSLEDDREKTLDRVMARHHNSGDALIEVLHAAQQLYGYLSPPLLKKIARSLKLPPSRVLGVATFYHLFRFQPAKAHTAVVCSGTACYVAGSTELAGVLRKHCGSHSEQWTLEEGRCVGSCGLAPIVICDGSPLSRLTPQQLTTHLKGIDDGQHSPSDTRS